MIIVTTMFASCFLFIILMMTVRYLAHHMEWEQGFISGVMVTLIFCVFSFWTWTLR